MSSAIWFGHVGSPDVSFYTLESPQPGITTPPLVSTLEEFRELCLRQGFGSATATATGARP